MMRWLVTLTMTLGTLLHAEESKPAPFGSAERYCHDTMTRCFKTPHDDKDDKDDSETRFGFGFRIVVDASIGGVVGFQAGQLGFNYGAPSIGIEVPLCKGWLTGHLTLFRPFEILFQADTVVLLRRTDRKVGVIGGAMIGFGLFEGIVSISIGLLFLDPAAFGGASSVPLDGVFTFNIMPASIVRSILNK